MKELSVFDAWKEFFLETVKWDEVELENKEMYSKDFARMMIMVLLEFGEVESVLWAGTMPSGTEDRTWVRAYLGAYAKHQAYQEILKGPDGAHAIRCIENFEKAELNQATTEINAIYAGCFREV